MAQLAPAARCASDEAQSASTEACAAVLWLEARSDHRAQPSAHAGGGAIDGSTTSYMSPSAAAALSARAAARSSMLARTNSEQNEDGVR